MNHPRLLAALVASLALVLPAAAGDIVKLSNTSALNLPASWTGNAVPGAGDVAVWDAGFGVGQASLGANLLWGGIRIGAPTVVPVIRTSSAFALTLGSSGIDMAAATQNFNCGCPIIAGASQAWSIASGRTLTLANGVAGTGVTVTKAGAGTVILNGTANFGGELKLDAGMVQTGAGAPVIAGTLSGSGGSLVVSGGALTLSGANSFSGGTALQGGQLNLKHADCLGSGALTITGGSLDNTSGTPLTLSGSAAQNWNADFSYVGSASLDLGATPVTMSGIRTVTVSASTLAAGGVVSGTGGVTKAGPGTMVLSGNNTYAGETTVTGGTLQLNGTHSSNGQFTLNGGTTANLAGTETLTGGIAQFVVAFTAGNAVANVSGTLNLHSNPGGDTLIGQNANGGNGELHILNGGVVDVTGAGFRLGNSGGTTSPSGKLTLDPGSSMTLDTADTGVGFILGNGAAGAVGIVNLNGGTLATGRIIRKGAGTGTFNFNGGTLKAGLASTTFMTGLSAANVGAGGARIDTNGNSITIAQPLLHDPALGAAADGGLVLTGGGTLTLTGAATYTGPTLVTDGTLALGTGGSLASSPVIELAETGTLNGGTTGITLPAGQTLTGTGTLAGKITVGAGATLAPGSTSAIGTLTGGADLTLSGTAAFRIDKQGASLTHDAVISNSVKFGGTLTVTATGAPLAAGNSFRLFDAGAYSGSFTTLNLPDVSGSGLFWDTSMLSVDGTLSLINHVPTPTFSPPAGGYVGAQSVTITGLSGTTIHYTTDGSDPLVSGTAVAMVSPATGILIPLPSTDLTLRAYASLSGFNSSEVVSAVYQVVSTGTWSSTSSGTWSDPANWLLGAVGDGSGTTADFSTLTLGGIVTVTLDGSRAIGTLKFGDVGGLSGWTLTQTDGTSTLTLATGAPTPVIHVENATTTITAPLAGTQGFVKTGVGTLVSQLAKPGLSGPITISKGEVRTDKETSLGTGTVTLGDANTGAAEVRVMQRGSDPWPPTDAFFRNPIVVAAGPTGRLVIGRQNAGNWASMFTGSITLNNHVIIRHEGADRLSIEGKITGTGNVTFEGPRTNVDNPGNDYVGTTTIASGAGVQMRGGAIPTTSDLIVQGRLGFDGAAVITASLSGSGVVNNWTAGSGRVLTVGADGSSHDAVFTGTIGDNLALVKAGNCTQTLAGANTYTGATTVNKGVLLVNGSLSASTAVAVITGASFGGTGTAAGTVTVNGGATLAPGNQSVGTLSTGPLALAGTYQCEVSGAIADRVTVTGDLTLTGSTLAVTALSATEPGVRVMVSYTGTRVGSFGGTLPGGYAVTYDDTAKEVQLTVPAGGGDPFATWATANGVTGGKGGDDDGDGVKNLMEFAAASNPNPATGGAASGPRGYPLMFAIGADQALTYTIAVRKGATFVAAGSSQTATKDQLTYTVEATNELAAWTVEPVTEVIGQTATDIRTALGAKITTPPLGADWEWHTFRTAAGAATDPNDFIRLKVAEVAP
jgi:autotransporter-associated beta strand protein